MALGLAVTLGVAIGCVETQEHPASGRACVQDIPAILWGSLGWEVEVEFEGCIVPCEGEVVAHCEVIVDEDLIFIDAWVEAPGGSPSCGGSCVEPVATCDWPEDLDGTYTVVYGEREQTVTLRPGDQEFCINAAW